MVGDNQSEIEGPLRADQIKGRLIAFVHKWKGNFGKESAVPLSLCSVAFMLPLRPVCFRITVFCEDLNSRFFFTAEFLSAVMFYHCLYIFQYF